MDFSTLDAPNYSKMYLSTINVSRYCRSTVLTNSKYIFKYNKKTQVSAIQVECMEIFNTAFLLRMSSAKQKDLLYFICIYSSVCNYKKVKH